MSMTLLHRWISSTFYVLSFATQAVADRLRSAVIRHLLVHTTPSIQQKLKLLYHRGRHCEGGNTHMVAVVQFNTDGGLSQAKLRTRQLAHFTNVLSFRYMKFNFCYSFVHIATINLSNFNMSCETVKKTIFKSTTPATAFVSVGSSCH